MKSNINKNINKNTALNNLKTKVYIVLLQY